MIKLNPGSNFPHTVAIESEALIAPANSYSSVADWCCDLIGEMDHVWTLSYDQSQGMVWAFQNRQDAKLFNYTWAPRSK
jgi:hypothetical protein